MLSTLFTRSSTNVATGANIRAVPRITISIVRTYTISTVTQECNAKLCEGGLELLVAFTRFRHGFHPAARVRANRVFENSPSLLSSRAIPGDFRRVGYTSREEKVSTKNGNYNAPRCMSPVLLPASRVFRT